MGFGCNISYGQHLIVQHQGWREELSIQSLSSAHCTAPILSFSMSLASFQLVQAHKEREKWRWEDERSCVTAAR